MKKSKWEDDADYYTDDSAPAWWEIIGAFIIMLLVIAILVLSAWSTK